MPILEDTKRSLSSRFKMKDLGESRVILGLDITRDRANKTLSLNQSRYAQKVIDRFGMGSARGQPTPMDPCLDLTQPSPPEDKRRGQTLADFDLFRRSKSSAGT